VTLAQWTPILAALAFAAASAVFLWFGVQDRVAGAQRVARRLSGANAAGAHASNKIERLVARDGALSSLDKFLTPQNDERIGKIRNRLNLAGYRDPAAVRIYFAVKWGIAIAGFIIGAAVFSLTMDPTQPLFAIISVLVVVLLSFFATDMWIERQIAYRKMAVERAFPDALDLLLVCLEAGHGMDQAIARVALELRASALVLATELQTAVHQLRAGRDREQVLGDFAWRTGVPDVKAFVTVLRQADQFGVSIAETLRVYAGEMRNKRFMRAEEKANMMPVKLALGAILFTVPPTIIVLIGPSIIMIVREMAKAASGG
jgi:tight adherence protein C